MRTRLTFDTELDYLAEHRTVIGVDEAGRGALAGPVVAAAVILDPRCELPHNICDSKKLTSHARVEMEDWIYANAIAVGIGVIDNTVIDKRNILQATYDAMHHAINQIDMAGRLNPMLLIDGNRFREHGYPHQCLVKGDSFVASIAAASIIAKTHRDRVMSTSIHEQFPVYGFNKHKGYGTEFHREMIIRNGLCSVHRSTFTTKILQRNVAEHQ